MGRDTEGRLACGGLFQRYMRKAHYDKRVAGEEAVRAGTLSLEGVTGGQLLVACA